VQISTRSFTVDDNLFYIHLVRDISVRVKAEEDLKRSEKNYKDLVEIAPIGIYVQVDSKIVFANRVTFSIFGARNEDDVIGHNIFEFLHPDYFKIFAYRINLLRDGMSSPIVEVKTLGLNGKSLDVEVTAKPIVYSGKPAIEVFLHDITIRKRAEYGVNLLASIVESCDDAILAIDMNEKIVYWNKGADNLYGYRSNEVIGKSISVLLPNNAINDIPGILEILKRGGQINHYNTYRKRKDGGIIRIATKISPILEKGEIIGASEIAYSPED
jgi:PAS domain S-box-containing protein